MNNIPFLEKNLSNTLAPFGVTLNEVPGFNRGIEAYIGVKVSLDTMENDQMEQLMRYFYQSISHTKFFTKVEAEHHDRLEKANAEIRKLKEKVAELQVYKDSFELGQRFFRGIFK